MNSSVLWFTNDKLPRNVRTLVSIMLIFYANENGTGSEHCWFGHSEILKHLEWICSVKSFSSFVSIAQIKSRMNDFHSWPHYAWWPMHKPISCMSSQLFRPFPQHSLSFLKCPHVAQQGRLNKEKAKWNAASRFDLTQPFQITTLIFDIWI